VSFLAKSFQREPSIIDTGDIYPLRNVRRLSQVEQDRSIAMFFSTATDTDKVACRSGTCQPSFYSFAVN
jgi:hypothetical protein